MLRTEERELKNRFPTAMKKKKKKSAAEEHLNGSAKPRLTRKNHKSTVKIGRAAGTCEKGLLVA